MKLYSMMSLMSTENYSLLPVIQYHHMECRGLIAPNLQFLMRSQQFRTGDSAATTQFTNSLAMKLSLQPLLLSRSDSLRKERETSIAQKVIFKMPTKNYHFFVFCFLDPEGFKIC